MHNVNISQFEFEFFYKILCPAMYVPKSIVVQKSQPHSNIFKMIFWSRIPHELHLEHLKAGVHNLLQTLHAQTFITDQAEQ